jgi:hypothetical protein
VRRYIVPELYDLAAWRKYQDAEEAAAKRRDHVNNVVSRAEAGAHVLLNTLYAGRCRDEVRRRADAKEFEKFDRHRRIYDLSYWLSLLHRIGEHELARAIEAELIRHRDSYPEPPVRMNVPWQRSLARDLACEV